MNVLKDVIHKIFLILGFKLIGRKELVKHNSFDAIHKFIFANFFNNKKELVIFDVGANDGSSIKRFLKRFPESSIYAFEPTKHLFDKIYKQFHSDKIKVFDYAIGESEENRDFYHHDYHEINSFYPMIDNSKYKIQRTKKINENEILKSKVQVIKIDSFVKKNNVKNIDILKIDTQGAEAEVLAGASEILNNKKVQIIELEHILGFAHKIESSFFKLERVLNKNKYKLIAIEHADNIISFSNYQTNLIYVTEKIYDQIRQLHEKNIDIKGVTYSVKHFSKL